MPKISKRKASPVRRSHRLRKKSPVTPSIDLVGEQVAANTGDHEWFVMEVTLFDSQKNVFELLEEDSSGLKCFQRKYRLPMSRIMPFPKKHDNSSASKFHPGRRVLAVYPGTRGLCKATVMEMHHEEDSDEYLLEFEHDRERDGPVPQMNVPFYKVLPLPRGYRGF